MVDKFRSKWIIISSLVFGVFAGLIKVAFFPYPEYNPPAIYPAFIAFLITAFWWGLIIRSERITMLRGGIVGALVGLLTPVLMWPFFLLFLALSENRFPEIFLWSLIYMIISLYKVGWLTTILGIVLGVVLVYFQRKGQSQFQRAISNASPLVSECSHEYEEMG